MAIKMAFDLGTRMGWAVLMDGNIVSGVWDFTPHRFEGGGMRYIRFRKQLTELLDSATGPIQVYFEEVRRHMGTDAAHCYGGFMALLTAHCDEHHIPYAGVPVQTIKRWATQKGNANKEQMVAAARAKWSDAHITDDNEADARWLLDYAVHNL